MIANVFLKQVKRCRIGTLTSQQLLSNRSVQLYVCFVSGDVGQLQNICWYILYTWWNEIKTSCCLWTQTFEPACTFSAYVQVCVWPSAAVFTDAQPTEAERELWEQVNKVLMEAMSVLQDLQSYSGAGEAIRQVSAWCIETGCKGPRHAKVLFQCPAAGSGSIAGV